MKLSEETKEFAVFSSLVVLVILIFSFILFKMTGMKVALGIIFVSLPFYLLLSNFEFNQGEKVVFSLLLGLTIFPSLVYLLGFFASFKVSIFVVFVVLVSIAFALSKYKKSKKHFIF